MKCYSRQSLLLGTTEENYRPNDPWQKIYTVFCPGGYVESGIKPDGLIPLSFFTEHRLNWNFLGRKLKNVNLFIEILKIIINAGSLEDIDFLFEKKFTPADDFQITKNLKKGW